MPKFGLWLRRGWRRLLFLTMQSLTRVTGFARARRLGAVFGGIQFRLAWRSRRRQVHDIAVLLGRSPDDPSVPALLREAYRVNTAAVLEVLAMFDRRQDERMLASQCEIEGLERLQSAMTDGRGAILLGAHMGNDAMLVVRLASLGQPVSVVYRQSRMMSERFFGRGLALYGIEGILANTGFRAYVGMLDALRRGRIVFMTMDQGTKVAEDGIVMRFLGKDMPMPAGPALLARQSGAPVLPVVTTASDPVWRFTIEPPVSRAAGATLASAVEDLARVTERHVLNYPQLWSWHHRRWCKYPLAPATQAGPR
jgi:KDO2-lipid IV(A) lauroyltransferase